MRDRLSELRNTAFKGVDNVNDEEDEDFGQCRCCVASGDLSHAPTLAPVTSGRRLQEAPQGTFEPGVQPFDCEAYGLPLQILKQSGNCGRPCQEYRMAMLNLATGDYDEVGSSGEWYLDDVIDGSTTNAAATVGYPAEWKIELTCFQKCKNNGYTGAHCRNWATGPCSNSGKSCLQGTQTCTDKDIDDCLAANSGVSNNKKGPCNS